MKRSSLLWPARLIRAAAALALATMWTFGTSAPALAGEPINGSGSTWSANAIERWISNVKSYGLVVNYSSIGSSAGRAQFKSGVTDFGVSEIPFGVTPGENPPTRSYAYMPVVAGGTSFHYHIEVGGRKFTNLKLSGETIAKIFTGKITNWNDPAITHDNGTALPSKKIIPVVRSDGSGTSAQFTLWMANQYASIWNPFCQRYLGGQFCGFTSNYPQFPGAKALAGSDGLSNFIHASYGDGAIGYVEYSYALEKGDPVAKVLNHGGYYVLPTASNVAVALTQARINSDLTQNLGGVYTYSDPRAYPLSSYSYFLLPVGSNSGISTGKGNTLSRFGGYFLCQGQSYVSNIGYSPLTKNLVEAGFTQIRRIPGADVSNINLATCGNPTMQNGHNVLLEHAPCPPPEDGTPGAHCGGQAARPNQPGTGGGGGAGSGAGGGTGAGAGNGTGAGAGPNAQTSANATGIDPETGQPYGTKGTGTDVAGRPVSLDSSFLGGGAMTVVLGAIAVVSLLCAVIGPPALSRIMRRGGTG
ncbi:phosphate ABC transporter substrate-binding protein PstS [Actinoallomurus vinaceus]|uniref:Phosphate ABC transporter substrate-binding protein PstS n=1 Tax=Actinoallomurus vinaceus TaxID=1080074 RepID=A0ABP8U602_9ACTN